MLSWSGCASAGILWALPALLCAEAPLTPEVRAVLPLPAAVIRWDADNKAEHASQSQSEVPFLFTLTNVSLHPVQIRSATGSCGCTVTKLPVTPWALQPGQTGHLQATMKLRGKAGQVRHSVTVKTDYGVKVLSLTVTVAARTMGRSPISDRQLLFANDCGRCHAEPAKAKFGHELYVAACAICHESPNRAETIPDLRTLRPTAPDWRGIITHGKSNSMMPAFAQSDGGPLDQGQIDSLVTYLRSIKHS